MGSLGGDKHEEKDGQAERAVSFEKGMREEKTAAFL